MPKDVVEAYKWFNLAAISGSNTPEGKQAAAAKVAVAAAKTSEQIAQGGTRVKAWKPVHPIKTEDLCK